jgi:mono/diheme cytochrome c family protein
MNGFAPFVFLAAVLSMSPLNAAVDNRSESPVIRAGHSIAVTTCIACHVVDSAQTVAPVFGGGIPNFQDIAKRQDATMASLTAMMKSCGGTKALARAHCWPANRISDRERAQVAAYILSLRS